MHLDQHTDHVKSEGGCMQSHCFEVNHVIISNKLPEEVQSGKQVHASHDWNKDCHQVSNSFDRSELEVQLHVTIS